jgi:two-component system LytT family response regulator
MLKALLIDDEPDARADLRLSLAAHASEVEIAGEAESLDEAEAALARSDYDFVFLDVQLRGATGFDLLPRIRPEARIVFVTAHDSYALRAFEINALDYLLKPVSPERLATCIRRIVADVAARPHDPEPAAPDVPLQASDVICLRNSQQGRFVRLADISAIEAEQNYSAALLTDGTRLVLRRTLKSWEDVLPATHFMRVHRTSIVNLARILRYERDREEHTLLFLEGVKEPINATRKLWPELQERMGQLRRVI